VDIGRFGLAFPICALTFTSIVFHAPYLRKTEMNLIKSQIKRFIRSEDGPTAVEYAVMLSLIIVVCLTAVTSIGKKASTTFTNVSNQLGTAG
jgi:pilus assembly protein Flp/PilA